MNIKRILRHLMTTGGRVRRVFSPAALSKIEQEIAVGEATHTGQICFVVEGALDSAALLKGQSARERALELFSHLRVWDTEQNNGVLIYLLLADRDVEILADRGIHDRASTEIWETICHRMEEEFRKQNFEAGVLAGIRAVSKHLSKHYPGGNMRHNELPDKPLII